MFNFGTKKDDHKHDDQTPAATTHQTANEHDENATLIDDAQSDIFEIQPRNSENADASHEMGEAADEIHIEHDSFGEEIVEEPIFSTEHEDDAYELGAHDDSDDADDEDEEKVSGTTKTKVIAALAILATAGYLAYWVQEPVTIRTDVLAENSAESNTGNMVAQNATSSQNANEIETQEIDVSMFGFSPETVAIDRGMQVRWTNSATTTLSIIGEGTDGTSFSSPPLTSGESFSRTFNNDATISFYSTIDSNQKGEITVGTGITPTSDAPADPDAVSNAINAVSPGELFGVPGAPTSTTTATSENDIEDDVATMTDAEIQALIDSTSLASPNDLRPAAMTTSANANAGSISAPTQMNETSAMTDASGEMAEGTEYADSADSAEHEMTEEELAAQILEETAHGAADGELSKTGPAEALYALAMGSILYFNRKKLALGAAKSGKARK